MKYEAVFLPRYYDWWPQAVLIGCSYTILHITLTFNRHFFPSLTDCLYFSFKPDCLQTRPPYLNGLLAWGKATGKSMWWVSGVWSFLLRVWVNIAYLRPQHQHSPGPDSGTGLCCATQTQKDLETGPVRCKMLGLGFRGNLIREHLCEIMLMHDHSPLQNKELIKLPFMILFKALTFKGD